MHAHGAKLADKNVVCRRNTLAKVKQLGVFFSKKKEATDTNEYFDAAVNIHTYMPLSCRPTFFERAQQLPDERSSIRNYSSAHN